MEIFVYKGEWNLPSIDYECVRLLTFIKFSGAPVTITFNGSPFSSPSGLLPYLKNDNKKFAGYSRITDYLKSLGYDVNNKLDTKNQQLVPGYLQYIIQNLYPYFVYLQWGDPRNIEECRSLYAKRLPFPFNFISHRKYIAKTNALMENVANFSLEDKIENHNISQMILDAKKCINWISDKLEDKKWFFGDEPSEVDATLYALFSIIVNMTLPNNDLQMHLKQSPKLVKYSEAITVQYFKNEGFSSKPNETQSNSSSYSSTGSSGNNDDEDPALKKKRYVLSGLFAFIAMSTFAMYKGIISIAKADSSGYIEYEVNDDDD